MEIEEFPFWGMDTLTNLPLNGSKYYGTDDIVSYDMVSTVEACNVAQSVSGI